VRRILGVVKTHRISSPSHSGGDHVFIFDFVEIGRGFDIGYVWICIDWLGTSPIRYGPIGRSVRIRGIGIFEL
jgi:hypothetical protein